MNQWLPTVIPIVFIPAFICFWCFVAKMLSIRSGWSRLAERFRTEIKPAGRSFSGQNIRMGNCYYNRCLTAVICNEGLYLSLLFLFRVGHPPLLIPWSEIYDPVEEKLMFSSYTKIIVGRPMLTYIKLSTAIMDEAKTMLQTQLASETEKPV